MIIGTFRSFEHIFPVFRLVIFIKLYRDNIQNSSSSFQFYLSHFFGNCLTRVHNLTCLVVSVFLAFCPIFICLWSVLWSGVIILHYLALFPHILSAICLGLGFSQANVITSKDGGGGGIQRDTQFILQTIKLTEPVLSMYWSIESWIE